MAQPPETRPNSGLGTASLVLGIIGLCFSLIPVIGVIAWPLVILGLIFGLVGLIRNRKSKNSNQGMCIAGVVTAGIGLVICVLWAVSYASATSEILNDAPGSQAIDQAPSDANVESSIRLGFGEAHTWSGGEEITVSAPTAVSGSEPFSAPPEGKRNVSLDVTITNKGDVAYNVASASLTAQHDGRVAKQNPMLGDIQPNVQLPPGGSTTFTVVYEINENPAELRVSVQPNLFATTTAYFSGTV